MDRPSNRHFAPGREFALIEALFDESHFSATGEGLGDDGYLLKVGGQTWAVSADASVEGAHYRLDWTDAGGALEKAVLSNLSDINAMGGCAALAFLTLGIPASWGEAEVAALRRVLAGLEARHGFRVAGGDTVRPPEGSFFSLTVLGPVAGSPLLRGNARPGHGIFLSGTLGRSAAGLDLLRGKLPQPAPEVRQALVTAHLRPAPPLELGPFLASLPGPVAAIDLSDGLSSELWHLSRQSGCRMAVEWGKLPYERELAAAGETRPDLMRGWLLDGGEEYQLLFTGDFTAADLAAMGRLARVTRIGTVLPGEGVSLREASGAEAPLAPGGWSH